MKTLKQLCTPRQSVFDRSRRDVVLDLTDLIDREGHIDPHEFFEENWFTDGMKRLLREAFRRFERQSAQGVFVLSQAMGGGKTHNMIALGLLAKYPELRCTVMDDIYKVSEALEKVRVVAFTGRESDAPFGIWGAIAEQLGKKEAFKDYYSPRAAPGQTAWINLLKGEPLLILLDELPPYLENARSRPIGNSDLSRVTTTALSNLLVAVGKDELANVCVVISDLKATYEGGSAQINRALEDLRSEVGRSALTLEPVGMNTDEIYHILRKRLFETLPDDAEILQVARTYAQAVRDAKQMDITSASPEKFTCDYLVPKGFDTFTWKTLLPDERFYLKGLDLESHGEYRAGAYQELARGFGVKDYQPLLSSGKANQTRLKTATEFNSRLLGHGSFGASLVRHALFAIREVVRTDEVQPGKNWLRTEVSNYWQQRKILIELLRYFSTMGLKVSHWRDEARAAQLLAGAVENDSI